MSFQEHRSEQLSFQPPLGLEPTSEKLAAISLVESFLEHTERTNGSQCPQAMHIDSSSRHDYVSAGHDTSTEYFAETQWPPFLTREIHYLEQEPQQLFPNHFSTSVLEYSPMVDFPVSIDPIPLQQSDLCGDFFSEWTQEQAFLDSSASFSEPTYSSSLFQASTPQMLPSLLSSPTSVSSLLPAMTTQSSFETRSPSDNEGQYTCEECHKYKSDLKSLTRHMTEVHRKPPRGQVQRGWFTCVCGYQACYSRRSNYTRHLQKCNPTKRIHQEYVCQCLLRHVEKAVHETHYQTCKEGAGHVGRPRRLGLGKNGSYS